MLDSIINLSLDEMKFIFLADI